LLNSVFSLLAVYPTPIPTRASFPSSHVVDASQLIAPFQVCTGSSFLHSRLVRQRIFSSFFPRFLSLSQTPALLLLPPPQKLAPQRFASEGLDWSFVPSHCMTPIVRHVFPSHSPFKQHLLPGGLRVLVVVPSIASHKIPPSPRNFEELPCPQHQTTSSFHPPPLAFGGARF